MKKKHVTILIGNLQRESPNRKLATHMMAVIGVTMTAGIVEIDRLPLYNEDLETNPPQEWRQFRERITQSDGVIFVTPEHLSSVPAVLMNALDVGSMPRDHNVWNGKPVAIAGVSTGMTGPFEGHAHLRKVLSILNTKIMNEPAFYLAKTEADRLTDSGTEQMLQGFMVAFEAMLRSLHDAAR